MKISKNLFIYLLVLLPAWVWGQSETHNFIRFDTTLSFPNIQNPFGAPYQWIVEGEIPANYFTPNDPDTASRIMFVTMPGQGQQGSSNYANLYAYGTGYWRRNGWDGGVTISNGKHYPLLFTVAFVNNVLPQADQYNRLLDSLIKWYHPRTGKVAITGFSQGAFTNGALIKFEQQANAETGMKKVSCAALFEGEPDQLPPPYNGWDRDTVAYKVWAVKYGGHYFTLEGSGSDNFRNTWKEATAMNDTLPGVAYFSYENLGGGAHCCWNSMWDPGATNWNCVTPPALGPNNAPSQVGKNQMGNYKIGDNVYTWMFRNSQDTTLVGGGGGTISVYTGLDTTINLPTNSMHRTGVVTPPSGATVSSYLWTQTAGPNTATLSGATTITVTASNLIAGTYTFQLRAIDNHADTGYDAFNVTVLTNGCRTFTWDSTNTNINITDATIGANPGLHRCDTVDIWDRKTGGGYRSFSVQNEGVQNDPIPGWIHIRGRGWGGSQGARLAPGTNNLFANVWDNNNWVHLDSFYMYNHPDPFIFTAVTNGYSHHMWFTNIGLQSNGCFFPSSTRTHSLPNWKGPFGLNGGVDTVNCLYDWTIEVRSNGIYGGGNGLTGIWIGGPNKNNVCLKWTVRNSYFDHYSSSSNPSTYVFAQNVFPLLLYNDSMSNLGNGGPYAGHASLNFIRGSMYSAHNIHFGPGNFGNDIRDFGVWDIPGMESFFNAIDTTLGTGASNAYNLLSEHKIKYPILETRNTLTDTSENPYIRLRQIRYFDQITGYSLAVGVGNTPYNASVLDAYTGGTDTIFLHNSTYSVLRDTVFNYSGSGVLTVASGTALHVDTANLYRSPTFAGSGLADTVKYYPVSKGPLFRTGVAARPWPSFDLYNNPRATVGPVDIGAIILFNLGCDCLALPIPIKFN